MEETLTIKIDSEKKEQLQELANSLGLGLSGLARMVLYEKLETENKKSN